MSAIDYKELAMQVVDEIEARKGEPMLTIKEVCNELKRSRQTIWRYISSGKIKAINGRVSRSELERYKSGVS